MLNSAINMLFCGHYRGREEAFVERVKSGWIDDLPNWKDVLCFENFSLSLIFLCKLSTRDHENMAVVERWPLVEIRLYFLCASREGASQRGRRKHSSLKEQVSRGSGKNCIFEGWISCAVILPGKEDEETLCWCCLVPRRLALSMKMCAQRKARRRLRARRRFACGLYPSHGPLRFITSHSPLRWEKRSAWGGGWCWCATFKSSFYLFIYLFIYLFNYIRKQPKPLGPLNLFKPPCNLFLSFFSQIFLSWAAQVTQEKKFKRYYQEFSLLIP